MTQMSNLNQIVSNYLTLYFMIHFIDNCKMLSSIMASNSQINVTFRFTKKFPFEENWQFEPNLAQYYATLCLMIKSKDIFDMFQHDWA